MSEGPALSLQRVCFRWRRHRPLVLDIESMTLARGERLFLGGPSGAGKSTLLSLVAGVTVPDEGRVEVLGRNTRELSGPGRDRFRADHLGVIFQMFNLLPWLPVLDNVMLPCRFSRLRRERAEAADGSVSGQARRLLGRLGLDADEVLRRPVTELSVGQQQRVAAARALMGAPELVVADEPTSALDMDRRQDFVALLSEQCGATGAALLFVSHDRSLADAFDRQLELDGINRVATEGAPA